jgi:hypothetical protein
MCCKMYLFEFHMHRFDCFFLKTNAAELMRVLWQFFDSWFLLVNLLIMFICVVISVFSKDPATPSVFSWANSLEHEQVCANSKHD